MADLVLYLNQSEPVPSLRHVDSLTASLARGMDPLVGGSTVSLEIRPTRDGVVDAVSMASGNLPRLILSVPGPTGPVELARLNTTDFSVLTGNDGWGSTLALTTEALRNYFADGSTTKLASLEITLVTASGRLVPLYLSSVAILLGYLASDDTAVNSTAPVSRFDITSHSAMRALVTAGVTRPTLFLFLIGGAVEAWMLRTKAAGPSEDDDDTSYIVPSDFNATTNNAVFVKAGIS